MNSFGFTIAVLPFITPMIFGLGAASLSIPIIIHLLNKRRFKIVVWAAMDFLLAAQRRNARRLKFHRWILLLLRCAALLVLSAAVAQFMLSCSIIGTHWGAPDRVVAIVWDDSYSMGYKPAHPAAPTETTYFEQSRKLLADYVAALPKTARVALILAARAEAPLVPRPTLERDQLLRLINSQRLSDAGTDLASAFDQAAEAIGNTNAAQAGEVLVITNGTVSSMNADPASNAALNSQRLKKAMEKLQSIAKSIRVLDLGQDDQANLGITSLEPVRPVVVANDPPAFRVTVRNGSPRPQLDVPVTLLVNNRVVKTEKILKIDPGDERTITMLPDTPIPTPGNYLIEARIPPDQLPADDVRRLVVPVLKDIPLLIVEGSPGDNNTLGSTSFVQAAYAPVTDAKTATVFAPHVITEIELARTPLKEYAAVILSEVVPDPVSVQNLKAFVRDGGCLMIFPGNRTAGAADALNKTLGTGADGLLPATLGQVVNLQGGEKPDAAKDVRFAPGAYANPVLEPFRGIPNAGLTTVSSHKYLQLKISPEGGAQTILEFNTAAANASPDAGSAAGQAVHNAPAVVQRKYERGSVILWALSADNSWTNFPAKPSFVPFLYELMYYGLDRDNNHFTLPVGGRINLPADAAPAGTWQAPLNGSIIVMTTVDSEGRAGVTSDPLTMAGIYQPANGNGAVMVAVNPDNSNADIRHQSAANLASALGLPATAVVTQPEAIGDSNGGTQDLASAAGNLGWYLIIPTLLLFSLEALCARWFSTYR